MTSVVTCEPTTGLDRYGAIKARQQTMWASGDYSVIGTTLQIVGERLCEAVDVHAGARVLDVAAGNGNASLAAARRFASVTSTDYVPALLERGRRRAEGEGLDVIFQAADAEALPYPAASFDVVLSAFGVMFTPDHERAAGELMRVCRRGGRIGLACWTPAGFIGQVFRVVGRHVPPIPGVRSPLMWGSDAYIQDLFQGAAAIEPTVHTFAFRYRSPEHWLEMFRAYYGPIHKAFAALEPEHQQALERDLLELLRKNDRGGAAGLVVPSEYLEIVITR